MPGPKLPEYPKPMFKSDRDPTYANNEKDEDRLASEGWSLTYVHRPYPKTLYHPTTSANLIVQSKEEEEFQVVENGWLQEPLPQHYGEAPGPKEMPLPVPVVPVAASGVTVEQFMTLQSMMLEQQALINSMLLEKQQTQADDTEEAEAPKKGKKAS